MGDLAHRLFDLEKKVDHYGFCAWLLVTATLKKMVASGKLSEQELDEIFSEAAKTYDATLMIPAERFEAIIDISSHIIKGKNKKRGKKQ